MSVPVVYDAMLLLMRAARPDRIRPTFELIESGAVQLFVSVDILRELRGVLTRPTTSRRFPALSSAAAADEFESELLSFATLVPDVPNHFVLERDPKDSKYINLAVAVNAPYLVTRDLDLLDLMDLGKPQSEEFLSCCPNLRIVDPATFINAIGANPPSDD